MQNSLESCLVSEMLEIEQNARQVLEEAKERGNRMMLQARSEARHMIEKMKEDLQRKRKSMEERLHFEGEKRVVAN